MFRLGLKKVKDIWTEHGDDADRDQRDQRRDIFCVIFHTRKVVTEPNEVVNYKYNQVCYTTLENNP